MGKNVGALMKTLGFLAVIGMAGLMALKADAKSLDDLRGMSGVSINDTGKQVLIDQAITIDGYELGDYILIINADNVTVSDCTVCSIADNGNNAIIKNNTVTGGFEDYVGIGINNVSGSEITGNTISNVKGLSSVWLDGCKGVTLSDNIIKDSAHYGINVQRDNSSIIKNNKVTNSASGNLSAELHGDGILLDNVCISTEVSDNTVDTVIKALKDYGNGIIVGNDCKDINVSGNTVINSGNHGMQVSYRAQNVTLSNNKVTTSQYQGISVSRGASVKLINNEVYDNVGNGIVYDGNEKVVTGTISGNIVYNNTGDGIYLNLANVTVKDNKCYSNASRGIGAENVNDTLIEANKVYDNGITGIVVLKDSNVTIKSNTVYRTTRSNDNINGAGIGIQIMNSSKADITGNIVANYGFSAVYVNTSNSVTMSDNRVSVEGASQFVGNAYSISTGTANYYNNNLMVNSITPSSVSGQTYYIGYEGGAVVDGTEYKSTSGEGGYFVVSGFPAQDSADKVIIYVKDNVGNAIYVNAPNSFLVKPEKKPKTPEQKEKIEGFIRRLYNVCLDREPDASYTYWTNELIEDKENGSQVAYGFIFSEEFKGKNYCNKCYLEHLYNAFMGRPSDEGGMNYWLNNMHEGMNREEVFNNFVKSAEFKGICEGYGIETGEGITVPDKGTLPIGPCAGCGEEDGVTRFVKRLYTICLNREPDTEGIAYHRNNLLSYTKTGSEVAKEFFMSVEFTGKNYDDATYIEYLYSAYMDRPSEEGGKNYWLEKMNSGMSREEVADGFASSEEFAGICKSNGIKPY